MSRRCSPPGHDTAWLSPLRERARAAEATLSAIRRRFVEMSLSHRDELPVTPPAPPTRIISPQELLWGHTLGRNRLHTEGHRQAVSAVRCNPRAIPGEASDADEPASGDAMIGTPAAPHLRRPANAPGDTAVIFEPARRRRRRR